MKGWRDVAAFLGPAYLRYSFTKGTDQETDFLVDVLGLSPATSVLDVGCGPGRHVRALQDRGVRAVGVDLAPAFAGLAPPGAVAVGDARRLPVGDESVDVAWSLCQGGLGLVGDDDGLVLREMARVVRTGSGLVVCSAFSSYFQVRHLEESDDFDAGAGVNREQTELRNQEGETVPYEFATSCFTPRELRLLCTAVGLEVDHIWSVAPGDYARRDPDLDHPEWLVVARKASVTL